VAGKTKLELTWIGKDKREKLEPRVLIEDEAMGHSSTNPDGKSGLLDNLLVKGDNLLALKALEAEFTNKIDCVYIDPPYNTGSAFSHYDDGLEHSVWLDLITRRLAIIYRLLSINGSIWISIDDREMPYLRVALDEIFGRTNFIASCVWQKRYSRENRGAIGDAHEYILVYAKDATKFKHLTNRVPLDEKSASVYKNTNNDPKGRWRGIPMTAQGYRPNQMYEITAPGGKVHTPPEGRCWGMIEPKFLALRDQGRIYFGKDNNSQPNVIRYLSEVDGLVPWTWWPHTEVGHTDGAMKESQALFGKDTVFPTPKPEKLIERVLTIATNPGDIVLDSFAGSGTTGAVAHKMGRRWIMVELGDHADTHIVPRMNKVINGEDPGGVTGATGWQGGGGYRYFRLAPSLLQKDQWGQYVISKEHKPEMLSEAVCKLMGFTYAPSQDHFWRHGHSTENDFIYVTTQRLPHDTLRKLSHEVGEGRSLLVCCRAHDENTFDNLTVRKIPHAVMAKCEWGRDDYSLNIQEAPSEPITEGDLEDDNVEAAE